MALLLGSFLVGLVSAVTINCDRALIYIAENFDNAYEADAVTKNKILNILLQMTPMFSSCLALIFLLIALIISNIF